MKVRNARNATSVITRMDVRLHRWIMAVLRSWTSTKLIESTYLRKSVMKAAAKWLTSTKLILTCLMIIRILRRMNRLNWNTIRQLNINKRVSSRRMQLLSHQMLNKLRHKRQRPNQLNIYRLLVLVSGLKQAWIEIVQEEGAILFGVTAIKTMVNHKTVAITPRLTTSLTMKTVIIKAICKMTVFECKSHDLYWFLNDLLIPLINKLLLIDIKPT